MELNYKDFYLKGRECLRQGNIDDAIKEFEKSLELKPDCKDAVFYTGQAWEKKEEFLMAQISYQKSIELDPLCKKSWESLYELYEKMKNWDDGLMFFEKVSQRINRNSLKLWLLEKFAIIYLTEKNFLRAEECYREILKLKPGYSVAVINLAKVYRLSDRHDEKAIDILKRAFDLDCNDASLVMYLARALRMEGFKDEQSVKVYRSAFKIDPSDQKNAMYLKNLFLLKDESADGLALELYNYFLPVEESKGELLFHRGLVWKFQGKWEKAIEDFKLSLSSGFSCEKHWPEFELAYCYYKCFDYRNSAEQLKIHLQNIPDHTEGWKMAKKVFFSKELTWNDEDFFLSEKIASKFSSDQVFMRLAGYAEHKLKDAVRAENLYMKALKENPNLLSALSALEQLYECKENWLALQSIYLNQINQFSSKPKKKIDYLYKIADLYWRRLSDYEKAEGAFAEILKLSPGENNACIEMAKMLKNKKDFPSAKEKLRNLIFKDLSYERAYEELAGILVEEGKIHPATQVYTILKLLFPENKVCKEFFSSHTLPAVKQSIHWERENEELLIHKNEKKLQPFLTWARIWCEKLYAPQINNEILRNASMVNESHRTDVRDMVLWCTKKISLGDIPTYVYYGKKNKFSLISCISPDDSYIIFHEDFLTLLSEREILFLLAHELCHIKREHHLYYKIKDRILNWTLGLTSSILFSKIPIPLPSVLKNWTKGHESGNLDFDRALMGLDFTADRYGLFFSSDIEGATGAIWKKYAFSKKKDINNINIKELIASRYDKDITARLIELWTFALSYEYEIELSPVTVVSCES
ncbi:MAG: tetratricopeptide repeat protein [Candidatus Eremiobacterota bacterium]